MRADRTFYGTNPILRQGYAALPRHFPFDELAQMRMIQLENERISTEAHIQYSELNGKYAAACHENQELKKLLAKEVEKNTLKTKSTFGRKTESFLSLVDAKRPSARRTGR